MKVYVQQLVAPSYRNDFFAGVEDCSFLKIEVHASQSAVNQPTSISLDQAKFTFKLHSCRSLFSGRLYWQSGMTMPREFQKGDVLVFNSNPRILSNFLLLFSAKLRGCKIVSWNHFMSSSSGRISSRLRKTMTKMVADHFFVYVDGEADQMQNCGYERSRITALNNTINTANVRQACLAWGTEEHADLSNCDLVQSLRLNKSIALNRFAEKIGIADSFNLLFCGRITEKSRLEILLKGFAELKRINSKKTKLVVIGDGDQKEDNVRLAEELGINSDVIWAGAIFDECDLAPWFLNSNLFVYPGAIGLSLNHAMAYGLPVVAHNNPSHHMPEFYYLEEGSNGFLFEEESSGGLANSVSHAIDSGQLGTASFNATRQVMGKYTFSNMVDNFVNGLLSLRS